jgi:glycine C-acetyltransferase
MRRMQMQSIDNIARHRRFAVRKGASLLLELVSKSGRLFSLEVTDFSVNGLAAVSSGPTDLELADIVTNCRLVSEGLEVILGRLVTKRVSKINQQTRFGFATIDSRLPISGELSFFVDESRKFEVHEANLEVNPDRFNIATFTESDSANADLFSRCKKFSIMYEEWEKRPRYAYNTIRKCSKGPRLKLARKRKGRKRDDYLVLGSNDYLGLASHPRVIEAVKATVETYGFGSTGSPLTSGKTDLHEELEEKLARMFNKQRALLFNSGYSVNIGVLDGLSKPKDLFVADSLSHASIMDGLRLCKANTKSFKHNRIEHLEAILEQERDQHSGCLVITEGVFSMDGDSADLEGVVRSAKKHNCRVFLDEAHSFGVLGETGLGLAHQLGLVDEVDIIMGTFSKICGGIGGFVASSKEVVQWLHMFARSQMFSVSIPPSTAAATLAALQVFIDEPEHHQNLRANIKYFKAGLKEMGYSFDSNHESAVIPVVIGDEEKLGKINQIMLDAGIYVTPIVYPAVSRKACRFRFTMMSSLTTSDLDLVLAVFESACAEAGVGEFVAAEEAHKLSQAS